MGLQGEREREARWEVVPHTECSPNYRRLLLSSLVGRLRCCSSSFLVSPPRVSATLVCGHSVVYSSLI